MPLPPPSPPSCVYHRTSSVNALHRSDINDDEDIGDGLNATPTADKYSYPSPVQRSSSDAVYWSSEDEAHTEEEVISRQTWFSAGSRAGRCEQATRLARSPSDSNFKSRVGQANVRFVPSHTCPHDPQCLDQPNRPDTSLLLSRRSSHSSLASPFSSRLLLPSSYHLTSFASPATTFSQESSLSNYICPTNTGRRLRLARRQDEYDGDCTWNVVPGGSTASRAVIQRRRVGRDSPIEEVTDYAEIRPPDTLPGYGSRRGVCDRSTSGGFTCPYSQIIQDDIPHPISPPLAPLPSRSSTTTPLAPFFCDGPSSAHQLRSYLHSPSAANSSTIEEPDISHTLSDSPPMSLASLRDPSHGAKPAYSLPTLIKFAILGSPRRRLTLQGIYQALEERFEWFRDNSSEAAWKNSIRHNLSLRKCFLRVQRPISEPGKGSYWTVDSSQGEGNKRLRKRNKRSTKQERPLRQACHLPQHFRSECFAPLQHSLQSKQWSQQEYSGRLINGTQSFLPFVRLDDDADSGSSNPISTASASASPNRFIEHHRAIPDISKHIAPSQRIISTAHLDSRCAPSMIRSSLTRQYPEDINDRLLRTPKPSTTILSSRADARLKLQTQSWGDGFSHQSLSDVLLPPIDRARQVIMPLSYEDSNQLDHISHSLGASGFLHSSSVPDLSTTSHVTYFQEARNPKTLRDSDSDYYDPKAVSGA